MAIIFWTISIFQYVKFWRNFKNINVGNVISNEFVDDSTKSIKFGIIFFAIGCSLSLIAILLK
ncbi:hypothetical protein [Lederbergia graminis]|uniref:hypothetical protein n=1 Tax=Lederbergia graminis TaxID=735518 RepID=UPI0036D383D8